MYKQHRYEALRGAPDSPESSVKRSRLQSQEAPRRRSCCVMKPPYCAFHDHTCRQCVSWQAWCQMAFTFRDAGRV